MSERNEICIKNTSKEGKELQALFLPSQGMNFISYKKGEIEVIDQSTKNLFEERFAGLGAMIGPHFHHRTEIPPVKNPSLFPHIARVFKKGTHEPFSHGIGRYAPWKVESVTENSITATLSGSDKWMGVSLQELEGQDFNMKYVAQMQPEGLRITLSVESDAASVVGLHTYYALDGYGHVEAQVKKEYNDKGKVVPLPQKWLQGDQMLFYELNEETDFGFFPFPEGRDGVVKLVTKDHVVNVSYECKNQEHSWQLWHPKGTSFVCIEPLSAKNPKEPLNRVSAITIQIGID